MPSGAGDGGTVALTLRLIGGLATPEIARAFLVPEKTVGQRIFRAKKTLAEAHVPFETPRGEELRRRVESVLAVVYLIYNEGYTATSGDEWMRAGALRRCACGWAACSRNFFRGEPEVHGLLALMELQASRTAARRGRKGEAILLRDQDRSLWDYAQIQRGMAALGQAQKLGGGAGNYALQAAIAACHLRARRAEETDWNRIVLLYDALMQIRPSSIVALNRAVAIGMAQGPAAGTRGPRRHRKTWRGLQFRRWLRRWPRFGWLPSAAQRARRPADEAGPVQRSARGNPARHHHDPEPARAGIAGQTAEGNRAAGGLVSIGASTARRAKLARRPGTKNTTR